MYVFVEKLASINFGISKGHYDNEIESRLGWSYHNSLIAKLLHYTAKFHHALFYNSFIFCYSYKEIIIHELSKFLNLDFSQIYCERIINVFVLMK